MKINWRSLWENELNDVPLSTGDLFTPSSSQVVTPPTFAFRLGDGDLDESNDVEVWKNASDLNVGDIVYRTDVPSEQRGWCWIVVDKEIGPDGNVRLRFEVFIHPDENPEMPGYEEYQYEEKIRQAYSDVVEEGAAKVKLALQAYVFVAEQFTTGPIYGAAGRSISLLATKADDLLRATQALRGLATKLRGAADDMARHIQFLKDKLVQVTDDLKAGIQTGIRKLEEGLSKLRGAADDTDRLLAQADDLGKQSKKLADDANIEKNAIDAGGPGGGGGDAGGPGSVSGGRVRDADGNPIEPPQWFGGRLQGAPEHVNPNMNAEQARSLMRQNQAGYELAKEGYTVVRLPSQGTHGVSNPDYRILKPGQSGVGELFDCVSPTATTDPRRILRRILFDKVKDQGVTRVVLNLDDNAVALSTLRQEFLTPSSSSAELVSLLGQLDEVIIVRNGVVTPFYPF